MLSFLQSLVGNRFSRKSSVKSRCACFVGVTLTIPVLLIHAVFKKLDQAINNKGTTLASSAGNYIYLYGLSESS